jgi:Putative addiction module component
MSTPLAPPTGFEELSPDEKIDYIQDLWDLTIDSSDQIQSPDWHLEIIRERLASFQVSELRTWDSVKVKLARQISEN